MPAMELSRYGIIAPTGRSYKCGVQERAMPAMELSRYGFIAPKGRSYGAEKLPAANTR